VLKIFVEAVEDQLFFVIVVPFIGIDLAGFLEGTHGKRRRWVGAEWGGVW